MDDLAAVAATIQAAQIQANYALWAAVIGAFGVVIAVYFTAKNTIKQIKLEKVAESKRDQYISLTDAYTRFLVSTLTTLPQGDKKDENWSLHLSNYIDLLGCINKVNLITTSNIRVELLQLEKELTVYQGAFAKFYFNNKEMPDSSVLQDNVFEFAKLLRSDLGIENDPKVEKQLIELRKA